MDALKTYRKKEYGDGAKKFMMPDKGGMMEKKDGEKEPGTSRIIKLSEEEMKSIGYEPGKDVSCEVHGKVEKDGHLHVMSVSPMESGGDGDMLAKRMGLMEGQNE